MGSSQQELAGDGMDSHADPAIGQRFEDLESRLAFLDHTVEELNTVIVRQDQEIRTLQQQVSELMAKLNDLGASAGPEGQAPEHEIPPHY